MAETHPIDLVNAEREPAPAGVVLQPESAMLRITTEPGDWRTFEILRRPADSPLNLTGFYELELTIQNKREVPLEFTLIAETDLHQKGKPDDAFFMLRCPPQAAQTLRLPIFHLPYTYSGWNWPVPWSTWIVFGWGKLDLARIVQLKVRVKGQADFALGDLKPTGVAPRNQWIDRFGQRSDKDWPGKILAEEMLLAADRAESSHTVPPRSDRDDYQAWAQGPQLEATGFFRTAEHNGRWWLVAPNGRLFFSAGLNCVLPGIETPLGLARVREAYSWLPPDQGELAAAWGTRDGVVTVNFYQVNMIRKWGAGAWQDQAYARALQRLRTWGFTTVGNWSDRRFSEQPTYPWVNVGPNSWAPGTLPMQIPPVTDKIEDVYHPNFYAEALRIAQSSIERYRDDPWLIGHFISNEVGWNEFFPKVLDLPETQPAKVELLADLRRKYGTVETLNAAWGSNAASFAELRWPDEHQTPFLDPATEDMRQFRAKFADRWYDLWSKVIREADPNHLVLGSRLHGNERFDEIIAAAARYCDVVSFNEYAISPDPERFAAYYAIAKKPFLVGEFSHNSLDTGNLTTAVPVRTQQDRAVAYRLYMETLASQPWFVGAHYFQYYDEPVTGRFDSETAYNGFVAVTDVPWQSLIEAATETNERLYALHNGDISPFTEQPQR